MDILTLDRFFFALVNMTAELSTEDVKVGACLVKDNKILSTGYNHFLDALINTDNVAEHSEGEPLNRKRNTYMCHAEMDAVSKYEGRVTDLKGSTLYITSFPCHECAKLLISLGIKEIRYEYDYHKKEICDAAKALFTACGIPYVRISNLN